MEAGSRDLDRIHEAGTKICDSLFENQIQQAALMGSLVKQIVELRECMKELGLAAV